MRQYSSGMLARLGFSLAAHSDAPVILVDEVLAVGDYAFQGQSLDRLRALAAEGRTLVIVTHNLPSVVDVCSRVVQLVDGAVAAVGPPAEVVAGYVAEQDELRASADHLGVRIGEVSVTPSEIEVGGCLTVSAEITVEHPVEGASLVLRIGLGSALYGGVDPAHETMERLVDKPLHVPFDEAGTWAVSARIDDFPLYAADYGIGFAVVRDDWEELVRRLGALTVHGDRRRRQLHVAVTETVEPLSP